MLGLKRHLPEFVVVAMTDGAIPGYSVVGVNDVSGRDELDYRKIIPFGNTTENYVH